MKKGFIIAAIILVAAGALIFAAAFAVSGFSFTKFDTEKYETNTYYLNEDFESIDISAKEADISFKQSEDGKTRVECVERSKVSHSAFVENKTLKITVSDERTWFDHISVFSVRSQSVTVYLPVKSCETLSVGTSTGDITVPDWLSCGDVKITASTGDIRIEGIDAEKIDLSVTTGDIECKNINCKETLSLKVSTGETVLTGVACKALTSNGSTGSIKMDNVVASESFYIKRSTGDVKFVNCDAGQITVETSTGDVTGTLRSEKAFTAGSSTGNVKVPDTVSGGKCEIKTSTGDIKIEIAK